MNNELTKMLNKQITDTSDLIKLVEHLTELAELSKASKEDVLYVVNRYKKRQAIAKKRFKLILKGII